MTQPGLTCQCWNLSTQAHSPRCGRGQSSHEASPSSASLFVALSGHLSAIPITVWLWAGTSVFPSVGEKSSPPATHLPEGRGGPPQGQALLLRRGQGHSPGQTRLSLSPSLEDISYLFSARGFQMWSQAEQHQHHLELTINAEFQAPPQIY